MAETIDISVRIGELTLSNPFIVGSGPTVRSLDQVRAARDAGWAAVCLKLTMDPAPYISLPPRYRWIRGSRMHVFTAEKRLNAREGLRLVEAARSAAGGMFVFANMSYEGGDEEGWAALASRFEGAGAHAVELNMCCPNMSFNASITGGRTDWATGASLGADLAALSRVVPAVRAAVKVPVIVKITPEGGRVAEAARICVEAGASAVGSTADRLGIPDIDIENPTAPFFPLQEGITLGCLSGPWLRPLGLRDTYEIRTLLGPEPVVIGCGGVSDMASAVRQIMLGADAVWVCTETMLRGFDWLPRVLDELVAYMKTKGWSRLSQMRDMLLPHVHSAAELVTHDGHAVLDAEACTSCGTCWKIGHCEAISHPEGRTRIDPARCRGCSTCVDLCPRHAIAMVEAEDPR